MSEKVKLYFAAGLAALGVFAYFLIPIHFGTYYPGVALILALLIAAGLFASSNNGKALLVFFREAYVELLKVVWPTRPEVVRSTAIIIGLIAVIAIFLWLVDMAL
ncbi:preprotein translocase subunit SecE, partial [Acidithiobacillus ferrooxidans]|nr:preprotein translocase subunit SecE [Acidithiobacillus ferrooxidans]